MDNASFKDPAKPSYMRTNVLSVRSGIQIFKPIASLLILSLLCRHIHVSLRDGERSLFAVSKEELKAGRQGAAYEDTKFISQEAEWFLAGILDGLPDSTYFP